MTYVKGGPRSNVIIVGGRWGRYLSFQLALGEPCMPVMQGVFASTDEKVYRSMPEWPGGGVWGGVVRYPVFIDAGAMYCADGSGGTAPRRRPDPAKTRGPHNRPWTSPMAS